MTTIDPILLSVYARTFKSITDEMSISMEQSTRSPILCEAKDYVTGLYDAEGRMLEQTENLPILAFSLAPVCKHIRNTFDGEIYQLTDAQLIAGPVQHPRVPILLAGGGEKVTLRLAQKPASGAV